MRGLEKVEYILERLYREKIRNLYSDCKLKVLSWAPKAKKAPQGAFLVCGARRNDVFCLKKP